MEIIVISLIIGLISSGLVIWLIRSRIRSTNEEGDNSLLAEYIQLLRESSTLSEDDDEFPEDGSSESSTLSEDDEEFPEDSNNNYE